VQLDGGEGLAMLEHPHDLWLSPHGWSSDLAGVRPGGLPGGRPVLGAVPLEQGLALVRAVLARFLDLATPTQSRMRQLLATCSDFVDRLGLDIRRDAAVLELAARRAPRLVVGHVAPDARCCPRRGPAARPPDPGHAAWRRAHCPELGDGSLRLSPGRAWC
jgi:precorrin-3B synthase